MKRLIILLLSISMLGCNENDQNKIDSKSTLHQFEIKNADSQNEFNTTVKPIIENGQLNVQKTMAAMNLQRLEYDLKLKDVGISTPLKKVSSKEQKNVDEKYRLFLKEHLKDKILPIFRAKYAQVILVDYELLNSKDYNNIEFYTKELINSETNDMPLIIKGLAKVKEGRDANSFMGIKNLALKKAEDKMSQNSKLKEIYISKISNTINNSEVNGNLKPELLLAIRKKQINDLEKQINDSKEFVQKIKEL